MKRSYQLIALLHWEQSSAAESFSAFEMEPILKAKDDFLPRTQLVHWKRRPSFPAELMLSCYLTSDCVTAWLSNTGSCESSLPPFTSTMLRPDPPQPPPHPDPSGNHQVEREFRRPLVQ